MKSLIKGSVATLVLALTSISVFAAGNGGADNSSNGAAAVGFFAVMLGALLLPAIGHKAHH